MRIVNSVTTRDAQRERTAERILQAARAEFAERGFEGATIRTIARRAGVHASLVMQHHGSKAALFSAAVELSVRDDPGADGHLVGVLAERLDDLPPPVRALMRSMLGSREAASIMSRHLQERIDRLAPTIEGPDAEAQATVVVTAILGLTIARQFLDLPSFERLSTGQVVDAAESLLGRNAGTVQP